MNMVRIDGSDKSYITQINTLRCKPEHQQELVEKMIAQTKEVMARQPGCISITLHRSTDGTQVVNYVQWQSKQLLDAAHATPEFQQRLQGYRHLVLDVGPHLFEVVAQIDTGQPGR
jgi:quinol monooxygenase YgiN